MAKVVGDPSLWSCLIDLVCGWVIPLEARLYRV